MGNHTLTGLCITPADETIHEKMLATLPTDCTADDIDPATHGLAILEIQRSHLVENDGIDGKFCAVGGFAQLTTVTPDAVTRGSFTGGRMGSVSD
jgi:hypothetical protein